MVEAVTIRVRSPRDNRTGAAHNWTNRCVEAESVSTGATNVHERLAYSSKAWKILWLPGLLCVFGSVAFLIFVPDTRYDFQPWLGVLLGLGLVLYSLVRRLFPE